MACKVTAFNSTQKELKQDGDYISLRVTWSLVTRVRMQGGTEVDTGCCGWGMTLLWMTHGRYLIRGKEVVAGKAGRCEVSLYFLICC